MCTHTDMQALLCPFLTQISTITLEALSNTEIETH